jgi:hypothetical protein
MQMDRRRLLGSPAGSHESLKLELPRIGTGLGSGRASLVSEAIPSLPPVPIGNENEGTKDKTLYVVARI